MMMRERSGRHGNYTHSDGQMLTRHRMRLGAHDISPDNFRSLNEERRSQACIASTLSEQPCITAIMI